MSLAARNIRKDRSLGMRIVYCFLTLVSLLFVVACTETATTLPATQGIDQATMEDNLAPTESPPDPCQSWRESEGLVVILSSEGEAEEDQSEEVSALLEDGRTCPLVTIAGDGDFWVSPEARWILWFEEGYLQVHDTTSEEMRSIALSGGPMDSGRSMIFDPSQTRVAIGQIDWSTRSGETMASPKGAWRLIMVDLESLLGKGMRYGNRGGAFCLAYRLVTGDGRDHPRSEAICSLCRTYAGKLVGCYKRWK
jgi:hypothetical protein